jgi:hypothetical protein
MFRPSIQCRCNDDANDTGRNGNGGDYQRGNLDYRCSDDHRDALRGSDIRTLEAIHWRKLPPTFSANEVGIPISRAFVVGIRSPSSMMFREYLNHRFLFRIHSAKCSEMMRRGEIQCAKLKTRLRCNHPAFLVSKGRRQQSNGTRHRFLGDDVTEPLTGEHCHNLSAEL